MECKKKEKRKKGLTSWVHMCKSSTPPRHVGIITGGPNTVGTGGTVSPSERIEKKGGEVAHGILGTRTTKGGAQA